MTSRPDRTGQARHELQHNDMIASLKLADGEIYISSYFRRRKREDLENSSESGECPPKEENLLNDWRGTFQFGPI